MSGLQVRGRAEGDEELAILFSSMLTMTLEENDVLVIYGKDKNLDTLETAVATAPHQAVLWDRVKAFPADLVVIGRSSLPDHPQ